MSLRTGTFARANDRGLRARHGSPPPASRAPRWVRPAETVAGPAFRRTTAATSDVRDQPRSSHHHCHRIAATSTSAASPALRRTTSVPPPQPRHPRPAPLFSPPLPPHRHNLDIRDQPRSSPHHSPRAATRSAPRPRSGARSRETQPCDGETMPRHSATNQRDAVPPEVTAGERGPFFMPTSPGPPAARGSSRTAERGPPGLSERVPGAAIGTPAGRSPWRARRRPDAHSRHVS